VDVKKSYKDFSKNHDVILVPTDNPNLPHRRDRKDHDTVDSKKLCYDLSQNHDVILETTTNLSYHETRNLATVGRDVTK
jgi:hypothetical protein